VCRGEQRAGSSMNELQLQPQRAGGDVGPTRICRFSSHTRPICVPNNTTAAITVTCSSPDRPLAQRTLFVPSPPSGLCLLAARKARKFAHQLTFAPNSNCTVHHRPRRARARHRQAGRPVHRALHYCIGCDSPQTTVPRPTSLFHASRGSGTLSVQACEVSRLHRAIPAQSFFTSPLVGAY